MPRASAGLLMCADTSVEQAEAAAGAFAVEIEVVPEQLAAEITRRVSMLQGSHAQQSLFRT